MSIICLQARAQKWFYAKEKNISVIKMHKSLSFEIEATECIQVTFVKEKTKESVMIKPLLRMCLFVKRAQVQEQTLFSTISGSLSRKVWH